MGVLPTQPPFLLPERLSAITRAFGSERRAIEVAQATARAEALSAERGHQAKAQQTALGNVSDISTFLGPNFIGSLAATGMPPEGALSGQNKMFAERGAELGQAGKLASNISDLGSGASSLVDAGVQLPGEEILAAIAGQNPENFNKVRTANQLTLAGANALAAKPSDNLFLPTIITTNADGSTSTVDAPTAPFESRAEANIYMLKNKLPPGQTYGTRLAFRLKGSTDVPPANIVSAAPPGATPPDEPDPDVDVDPDEPDPANAAAAPPAPVAGTEEEEAWERRARVGDIAASPLPVPEPGSVTTTNEDGSTTTTIPGLTGNHVIQRNLDGSGTITVPDGRSVPFTAEQAANIGL